MQTTGNFGCQISQTVLLLGSRSRSLFCKFAGEGFAPNTLPGVSLLHLAGSMALRPPSLAFPPLKVLNLLWLKVFRYRTADDYQNRVYFTFCSNTQLLSCWDSFTDVRTKDESQPQLKIPSLSAEVTFIVVVVIATVHRKWLDIWYSDARFSECYLFCWVRQDTPFIISLKLTDTVALSFTVMHIYVAVLTQCKPW